jgi:hypothetical protein
MYYVGVGSVLLVLTDIGNAKASGPQDKLTIQVLRFFAYVCERETERENNKKLNIHYEKFQLNQKAMDR